jgi:hypothetical protein
MHPAIQAGSLRGLAARIKHEIKSVHCRGALSASASGFATARPPLTWRLAIGSAGGPAASSASTTNAAFSYMIRGRRLNPVSRLCYRPYVRVKRLMEERRDSSRDFLPAINENKEIFHRQRCRGCRGTHGPRRLSCLPDISSTLASLR